MKKVVNILAILLIIVIGIGKFLYSDSIFLNIFIKEFNTTVNILTKPEIADKTIIELQKIVNKNDVSFIKEEYIPKNSRFDKQKIKIYIYLNDSEWFKKSFRNISIADSKDKLNNFKNVKSMSLLTSKDINLIPFESVNKEKINGDYHIRGKEANINKFIEEVNQNKKIKMEAVINSNFIVSSEFTQKQAYLYMLTIFIIFITIIFCLIIYNGILSKELSISILLGYNKLNLAISKTLNLLAIPIIMGLVLTISIIGYLVVPSNILEFIISMKTILIFETFIVVVLILIETILIYIKLKGINIIALLKGYRRSYHRSSSFIKISSIVMVFYLSIVSFLGLTDYLNMKQYIPIWKNSKYYANMACAWSWSYEKDDNKFHKIVIPKLNNLWNRLDDHGAILFNAPNVRKEGMNDDEDYINQQSFQGNYAYVNKNYLHIANLVDKNMKRIDQYKIHENEWIIFVPENVKITKFDKEKIHKDHIFQNIKKQITIVETYVRLRNNQSVFSFDSGKRIDEANLKNYVLIAVNGKELLPDYGIKLSSLVNGQLHPFLKDPSRAYESLKGIIEETESEPFILYISSVYDDIISRIDEYKMEATIYSIGLALAVVILATLLKIDKETYFYNHGQRIDVSRLLGYDFFDIHYKKIIGNIVGYIISVFTLFIIIMVTGLITDIGLFIPRDGWSMSKLLISLMICICGSFICFGVEILQLKKNERSIVLRLKEGC